MKSPKSSNSISEKEKETFKGEIKKIGDVIIEGGEKADFDMIELQFGHGYLAAQFLSPFVNDRDDEYGGIFEHRVRFALNILLAVKEAVHLPIIIRISGDEMIPNGIKTIGYRLTSIIKSISN